MDDDTGALPSKQDFSAWYNDLLWRAEILDVRYPVKGLYVWFPFGFALRKHVYQKLRDLLDRDHQETLFPLLIPEQEFMKEAEHIKGFEEEVYWVTHGGTTPLDVKLALRPTSETAIYPMYALWVRSHADLPIKYYQIVNTFRYETKQTRPLIRLREITSFKEAHTVDAIMPNGKTLQIGTVHHLGDHFSRTFCITYEDKNGEQKFAQQTCYGISERSIAALISIHGDDRGLILPPAVATVQAVIVPITIGKRHDDVMAAAKKLCTDLTAAGFRVKLDSRDMRPGAKYYWWELRGVPLRLELGPRDLDAGKVMAVTRTGQKLSIELVSIVDGITTVFREITDAIRERAEKHTESHLCSVTSLADLTTTLDSGNVAVVTWCQQRECGDAIETKTNASILGTDVRSCYVPASDGPCIECGKPGKATLVGRAY